GLISIGGGKLTTYRLMAQQGVDLAVKRLRERFNVRADGASTADAAIAGALGHEESTRLAEQISHSENLPPGTARHLIRDYGAGYQQLVELLREDEQLREKLVEGLPHIRAEVVYAARHEMALALADVMTRRMRLAILAGRDSVTAAAAAAKLMAKELDWDGE